MGKIVVKKVQSQAGNVAFTLPSADGSANEVLKTDGAGNLGWTDKTSSIGSASGISYSLPNADGTANQALQTTDANGTLSFVTPETNPYNTPDGNHQGLRLCDKYFFGKSGASVASITLTVPSSYTTTGSNILEMEIRWSSVTWYNYNETYFKITPVAQNGSTLTLNSNINTSTGYKFEDQSGDYYNDDWQNSQKQYFLSYPCGEQWGRVANSGNVFEGTATNSGYSNTTNTPAAGFNWTWRYFNSACFPHMTGNGTGMRTPHTGYASRPWGYTREGPVNSGYPGHTSNTTHSFGFKIEPNAGASYPFRDGSVELYARFKDGVV